MRALETGRFLLRSANTGVTAVVAPDGKITRQLPLFKAAVLTTMITPMGGMTPYARLGDQPIIGVLMLLLLGMWVYNCVLSMNNTPHTLRP
jgi:apolipoprotein N-acyltransferase